MTYAMTLDNSWEIMTEEEMYDVNGGGTLTIGFGVMLTPGLVAGLLSGTVTRAVVGSIIAKSSIGGLIGLAIGAASSLLASILIQALTNKIIDSLGDVPYYQMFYVNTSLKGFFVPNGNVVLNLGSLGF